MLENYEIEDIIENKSFILIYKNKKGIWRIQFRHTKKEKLEIKSIIMSLLEEKKE